jgi:hypothetical protein
LIPQAQSKVQYQVILKLPATLLTRIFLHAVGQLRDLKHFSDYFAFSPKSNHKKQQRNAKK